MLTAALLLMALGTTDQFGIPQIFPTAPNGREWYLPVDASATDTEWLPDTPNVGKIVDSNGSYYFHTCGDDISEVRLNVMSPSGKAWWHNVEMTFYVKRHSHQKTPDQLSHVELLARSERHSTTNFAPSKYNSGVPAPAGTVTPPGYPYTGVTKVNAHCMGTSYHGNVYDGYVLFEKEVSHYGGYSGQEGAVIVPGLNLDNWTGVKFILYNVGTSSVHMELWIDIGEGFDKVSSYDDTGNWSAEVLEGCQNYPYRYTPNILMTWAGPQAIFRSDSMGMDFKFASIREISPQ